MCHMLDTQRTLPPPPVNFVHGSYMLDMDIIDHVAAALGLESVQAAVLGQKVILT